MEEWEVAWLNCQDMPRPPFVLARELLLFAHDTAERWLFDARFRCIVEEWLPTAEAEEIIVGLLYTGFCLRGQEGQKRVPPIPILVELLYRMPLPETKDDTRDRMRNSFTMAM